MVGVPTSKGCSLCLRRAVKCDEARPACGQCRKGGRECPGYNREMRFIDEGPKLQRRRIKTSSTSSRSKAVSLALARQPESANLKQSQLLSSFISTMFPLTSAPSSFLGSWLWHIPPRLGRIQALDYASLSLALIYHSQKDQAVRPHAQEAYGIALRALTAAITSPKSAASSEVLGAALLLGYYETFANVAHAWVRHARGAARLLQLRGPRRCYESTFDYSMFLACRGSIISEALLAGTSTFLDSPDWQAIPGGLIEFPLMPNPDDGNHTFFILAAALPGVLSRGNSISDTTCIDDRAPMASVLEETYALKSRLAEWYQSYTSVQDNLRRPVVVQDKDTEYYHLYHDTASATMITTYYAYLILLNKQISRLEAQTEANDEKNRSMALSSADKENHDLARKIDMSVYYCSSRAGYCGATTLRMVLPIARSAQANM